MKSKLLLTIMVIGIALMTGTASAVQMDLENSDFEDTSIPPTGAEILGAASWAGSGIRTLNVTSAPWFWGYGGDTLPAPHSGDQIVTLDGPPTAGMGYYSEINQAVKEPGTSTAHTLAANETYNISMWVGRMAYASQVAPEIEVAIYAGGTIVYASGRQDLTYINPGDDMVELTFTFDTGDAPAGLGNAVVINIINWQTSGSAALAAGDEYKARVMLDDVSVGIFVNGPRNVAPLVGAVDAEIDTALVWKAPLDLDGLAADPNTTDFVVYCDPDLAVLNAATLDDHTDIDYYSDQAVMGVLASDPNQTFDPAGDQPYNTTYYWRVDTRRDDATEPNDVVTGPVWSFATKSLDPTITNPVSQTVDGTAIFEVTTTYTTSVQWYKDGTTTINDGGKYTVTDVDGVSTLTITGVTVTEEGDYHCIASKDGYPDAVSTAAGLLTERLYGHWKFDNGLTDSVQDTVAGAPTHDAMSMDEDPNFAAGHVGSGTLALNDTGAEVITGIADFDFFARGHTISCWAKIDAAATESRHYLVTLHPSTIGGNLLISTEGNEYNTIVGPSYASNDGFLGTGTPVNAGQWQYFATTYEVVGDIATHKLYVDGELVVTDEDLGLFIEGPPTSLMFGRKLLPYTDEAAVDNVKIYTHALDEWAIATEYVADDPDSSFACAERPVMDIAPVGALDCEVNLLDFVEFAKAWLENGSVSD